MKRLSLVVLALGSAALAAEPAAAQGGTLSGSGTEGSGRGLVLGLSANATRLSSTAGAGMGATLGYGVTEAVTLFARGSYGYQSTQVDLGARYTFGDGSVRVRPYFEGALTRVAHRPDAVGRVGFGATAAGGVEYRLGGSVALDLGVSSTVGRYRAAELPSSGFSTTRLSVGLRLRP